MGVGGQHAPAALPPGKDPVPIVQGRSGRVRKISPPPTGFDPRTVQPVGSSYTDCGIAPPPVISDGHKLSKALLSNFAIFCASSIFFNTKVPKHQTSLLKIDTPGFNPFNSLNNTFHALCPVDNILFIPHNCTYIY